MAGSEKLTLTYDGKLAASGEMLLYEYGRSQYAFSRIVTTIEQYRRRRVVLQKIAPSSRVRLKVKAPTRGSFKLEVDVDTSPDTAIGAAEFDVLMAIVLDKLIPGAEEFADMAKKLAVVKVAEWRGEAVSDGFDASERARVTSVAEGEVCSSELIIKLIGWAKITLNRSVARLAISQNELERAEQIIRSDIERKSIISKSKVRLNLEEINRLTARIRPMFSELAVPLGDSADVIWIGSPALKGKYYAFDRERLDLISARSLDEEEVELDIKIKNFDVESGHGSMRIDGESGVQYFSIEAAHREDVQPKIIAVMDRGVVSVTCAVFTDANGIITSYVIRDVDL